MAFRFAAKKVALTYPQCTLTKEEVRDALEGLGELHEYAISREEHKDGGFHIHAFASYSKKIDTRNVRFFDIGDFHPNVQKVKNKTKWIAYVIKDGDYIQDCLFKTWTNFRKSKADLDAWLAFRMGEKLVEPTWPVTIFGSTQVQPTPALKKCNWLIIGPPDSGKTRWVEDTFQGKAIWKVTDSRYPFEGYSGQQVIIWDDTFPKRKTLIAASNVFKTPTQVGDCRFRQFFWKLNQRNMIVLLNNELPTYASEPWFLARFNIKML